MELTQRTLRARRTAAIVVAAAAAALALPGAASAAVTGEVAGNTATLTGDGSADTIVISVDNGALQHNLGTATGFVNASDFDSEQEDVQALTDEATLTIDGAGGDDIITGGPNADALIGGSGSDRLTGFRGNDTGEGGEGNDTFVWNNGDGTDTNDGQGGVGDEQVMNGRNTTDNMTVKNIAGGRVRFDRDAPPTPGAFGLDMGTIERLTLNPLQGDDKLVTSPGVTMPITVAAGPGADDIATGDAADLVQGGEGVDALNGGLGGDRIVGNPGDDVMNGNGGDDVLVWNNGDGRDDMNGDDGLDRIENNLGAANDVSSLKVLAGKVRYERTNAPFDLDIASSEVFELNTFGGDDTLDVSPGVGALIAVVADAGAGNDRFTGGDETDTFFGGLGNDTLDPGPGLGDVVDGQDGDDVLNLRDNAADLGRGGAGNDRATADLADVLADVETSDVPAAPVADTMATAARVLSRRVTSRLRRGRYTARIRVECPSSEPGGCAGTLVLQSARKLNVRGVKVNVVVASKRFNLRSGQRRTLAMKLPNGVRRISRRGTLQLRAVTTSRDAAGNVASRSSRLAVKLRRR